MCRQPTDNRLQRSLAGTALAAILLASAFGFTFSLSSNNGIAIQPASAAAAGSGGGSGTTTPSTFYAPMYSWPVKYVGGQRMLSDPWQGLYSVATSNPNLKIVMVLNPDNGNFGLGEGLVDQATMTSAQPNADIYWAVQQMRQAPNIAIIGYVYTSYGNRDIAIAEQRIDLYKQLYNITKGIFFDEMANTDGKQQYYRDLTAYTRNVAGMTYTMGNPGTSTLESYVGTVDTLLVYEGKGYPTIATIQSRTFNGKYDKNNFGVIPYGVTRYDAAWVSKARGMAGYIYVTEDTAPNPWDTLSKYSSQLARDLQ
jgi:hypothetical protein